MKKFLRWLGIVLAALLSGVIGGIFFLAWRASKRTGKSVIGSLADIPEETELLTSEAKSRTSEALSTGLKAARDKGAALKNRIPLIGGAEEEAESRLEESRQAESPGAEETQVEATESEQV